MKHDQVNEKTHQTIQESQEKELWSLELGNGFGNYKKCHGGLWHQLSPEDTTDLGNTEIWEGVVVILWIRIRTEEGRGKGGNYTLKETKGMLLGR